MLLMQMSDDWRLVCSSQLRSSTRKRRDTPTAHLQCKTTSWKGRVKKQYQRLHAQAVNNTTFEMTAVHANLLKDRQQARHGSGALCSSSTTAPAYVQNQHQVSMQNVSLFQCFATTCLTGRLQDLRCASRSGRRPLHGAHSEALLVCMP